MSVNPKAPHPEMAGFDAVGFHSGDSDSATNVPALPIEAGTPSCAIAVLTCNAQSCITGWIAWHLALGCTHILVIDGGSDDGTEACVRILGKDHPVEWHCVLEAPASNLTQEEAGKRRSFLVHYAFEALQQTEAQWLAVLDSDEYLAPSPSLQALLQRGERASAIALNWCIYGSAGHRKMPKGHIAHTHRWRADHAFADHQITRFLVKSDCLSNGNPTRDKGVPSFRPEEIIHADGTTFTAPPVMAEAYGPDISSNPVEWKGGRILHYIVPAQHYPPHHLVADSSPASFKALHRHFDRNDIEDHTAQDFLPATRRMQNSLWESSLNHGIIRLKEWAVEFVQTCENKMQEEELFLTEKTQFSGENFSYSCQRFVPDHSDRLLLSHQAMPPYGINRLFTLRDSVSSAPLTEDSPSPEQALIGMIQDNHSRLLCLFRFDAQPFILGDCPCPHNMAALLVQRTQHTGFFALPEETGRAGRLFEAVPYTLYPAPDMLSLPLADENTGLSLKGVLLWVSQHPAATPQDFMRVLLLLTPEAAVLIAQTVPELAPFLPHG